MLFEKSSYLYFRNETGCNEDVKFILFLKILVPFGAQMRDGIRTSFRGIHMLIGTRAPLLAFFLFKYFHSRRLFLPLNPFEMGRD